MKKSNRQMKLNLGIGWLLSFIPFISINHMPRDLQLAFYVTAIPFVLVGLSSAWRVKMVSFSTLLLFVIVMLTCLVGALVQISF